MSNTPPKSNAPRPRLLYLAAGFLIISLVFVAMTFYLQARNAKHEQEWVSLATDIQVTSQQLAKYAGEAAFGNFDAFAPLGASQGKINSAMTKLKSGSISAEIPPISKAFDAPMRQLSQTWDRMSANASRILDSKSQTLDSDLLAVRVAADDIFADSGAVFDQAAKIKVSIAELPQSRLWPSITAGVAGLAAIFLVVWYLMYLFLKQERLRAQMAAENNRKNEMAVLKLLDEMRSLADGDLTVKASVTGNITGAIAESFNFAIQQLRELVKGITYTAQEVASSAMQTRGSTSELAKAAAVQADQVGEATQTAKEMAQSLDTMAKRSHESSVVARESVDIAHAGGEKVRETINEMDTIREQIQGTAKRIKRLGESTQEIGDIVELINGFAEQTNILALNAAIQAASAGGAGKGFAVVADEVQQLAESATNATRRIESLVQTIQTDTYEAVVSMESTTSEVVSGARLAEDAGTSLEQIELVSKDLSKLISEIAEEAHTQSLIAMDITELMKCVQDVSILASEGSTQAASSVDELAELVMQLSDSVTDFKLPEDEK